MPTSDQPATVTAEELERLRLQDRRFAWLLELWCRTCREDNPRAVLAVIDYALEQGHTPEMVAGSAAERRGDPRARNRAGIT